MADRYNVTGGSGTWDDTSNWATSSGGSSGASVPGSSDKAIFDGNSDNCDVDTNIDVLELEFTSGYGDDFLLNGYDADVGSGGFSVAGGTVELGPGNVTVVGSFTQTGGLIDGTSGTLAVGDDFDLSGGTYNHGYGKLLMNTPSINTLETGGADLYDLELDKAAHGLGSVPTEVVVLNDFTITSIGNAFIGDYDVRRHVITNDVYEVAWRAHIKVTGAVAHNISGTGGLPGFEMDVGAGSITFVGDRDFGGGQGGNNITFKYVSGTINFPSKLLFHGQRQYIETGVLVLPDVEIATGAWDVRPVGTVIVGGTLTVTSLGAWDDNTGPGQFELRGDIDTSDATYTTTQNGIWKITGGAAQTLSASGGFGYAPSIEVAKDAGTTLTVLDNIGLSGASANTRFKITSGLVDFGTSTITLREQQVVFDLGATKLWNLYADPGVYDLDAVGGTLYVENDLEFELIDDVLCDIEVEGDIVSADPDISGSGSVKLVGTGDQLIDVVDFPNGNVVIDKPSGSAILAAALTLGATGQDLVVAQGTLDLAGFDLTVDDIFDIDGTLKWKGSETLTVGTLQLDATQSTVIYYDTPDVVLNDLATAFFNLTLGAEKLHEIEAGTEVTVAGTLASDGIVSTKALLRSDTPGTLAKVTLSGSGASTMAAGVLATDIDSRDGNQVDALGSVANNCYNWHVSDDIRGVPLNSPVVRRPGPRSRQLVQGVMEWT